MLRHLIALNRFAMLGLTLGIPVFPIKFKENSKQYKIKRPSHQQVKLQPNRDSRVTNLKATQFAEPSFQDQKIAEEVPRSRQQNE